MTRRLPFDIPTFELRLGVCHTIIHCFFYKVSNLIWESFFEKQIFMQTYFLYV